MCRLDFSHANGTYNTYLESMGPDQCPRSVNTLHDHSQDYQEGLECTQIGHFKEIRCLKEHFDVVLYCTIHMCGLLFFCLGYLLVDFLHLN